MKNEQKFYSALENIFIGEAGLKIEGKSGFVNLMKLKSQYFAHIKPFIEKEVNDTFGHDTATREEAFQKLFTFFESYLNEIGTPFFSQTPFHKNLYEKVYSERDDVSLFWKTQRLYYVKSEANYHSLQNLEVEGLIFNFDASEIEHQKNNEKVKLEFWANKINANFVTFKVVYQDGSQSKWDRLKEYLKLDKPDKIRKHLAENFGDKSIPNIVYKDNGLNRLGLKAKSLQSALLITNNDDLSKTVTVEFALYNLEDLDSWAKHNKIVNLTERESTIKKAQMLYKKQNEVDYFIHKDAEGFLKEQLDMFLYQYLFGDRHLENEWKQSRIETIQKLKRIAHKIITYIARFEDELKSIWEKNKIVKQVNYVFTLDRLFPLNEIGERDFSDKDAIALIEKIIVDKGFVNQIDEWKELGMIETIPEKIINKAGRLNNNFIKLPIDTKHFNWLKWDLLSQIQNIEEILDGVLIKSDNWQALNSLKNLEMRNVQLIYIDPPFNTGEDFIYKDKFRTSTWLSLINDRLSFVNLLLNEEGTFYLHLDENANYLGRMLLNDLGFFDIQEISFDTNATKDPEADLYGYKSFGNRFVLKHSTIFVAYKQKSKFIKLWKPNRNTSLLNIGWLDLISKSKKGLRKSIADFDFFIEKYDLKSNLLLERIDINEKIFPLGDIWNDLYSFTQSEMRVSENLSFLTQKPENLLRRIIQSSSEKSDIVLDYFSGSGTTLAVAHKLGRKWIGIEQSNYINETYLENHEMKIGIKGRLKIVLNGDINFKAIDKDRRSHLSKDINWEGGGLFKYYELEQYEECLARASYNSKWLNKDGNINKLEQISIYTFRNSEKLLSAMIIDEEKELVKIHFQNLYPEMDEAAIAESISNVSGKRIKILNKEKVEFEDGSFIEFEKMNYDDKIFRNHYKTLLWWKSKE